MSASTFSCILRCIYQAPVAQLEVFRVGKEKKNDVFKLYNGENTIGRKPENTVTLDYAWY